MIAEKSDVICMTLQGTVLAARLYKDAVIRNRIPEDPAIPLASLPEPSTAAAPPINGAAYHFNFLSSSCPTLLHVKLVQLLM